MLSARSRLNSFQHPRQSSAYNKVSSLSSQNWASSQHPLDKSINTTIDTSIETKQRKSGNSSNKQKRQKKQFKKGMRSSEMLEIFEYEDEQIENFREKYNFSNSRLNTECSVQKSDSTLRAKFHQLFDLYVQEEILKHYCAKTGWKFQHQNKFMEQIIFPTLQLLAIRKSELKNLFQPFLSTLSQKYLLKTHIDPYSMSQSPTSLLLSLSEIWIKIKQCQISLKRLIRESYSYFKHRFCMSQYHSGNKNSQNIIIDRKNLYNFLYKQNVKNNPYVNILIKQRRISQKQKINEIKMVNVIKVFIFYHKVNGENGEKSLFDWLQLY